jgi:hypothetical protein
MERGFAASFSGVQVHFGRAAELRPLHAVAATSGERIVFSSYRPSRSVVAHELAHVLQFRRSRHRQAASGKASTVEDSAERDADAAVSALARGAVPTLTQPPSAAVMRLEAASALALLERAPLLGSSVQAGRQAYQSLSLDIDALARSPLSAIPAIQALLGMPEVGPTIRSQLQGWVSERALAVLDLDPETLATIGAVLEDPSAKVDQILDALEPHVAQIPALAQAKADEVLTRAEVSSYPARRVVAEVVIQISQLATNWRQVVAAIVKDTFALWDWSSQAQELQDLDRRYKENLIGDFDWYLGVVRIVLGGLDRILGAVDIAMWVVALLSGIGVGGAAGGTAGAGVGAVGGGVVGAGAGAVPGAAGGGGVGGGTGAAAGGALGGAAAATIHAWLSAFSIGAAVGVELVAAVKAAQDLEGEAQTTAQDDEDYRQVASSIITLAIMLGMFALGPIASRIGKTLSRRLKEAAGRLQAPAVKGPPTLSTPDLPATQPSGVPAIAPAPQGVVPAMGGPQLPAERELPVPGGTPPSGSQRRWRELGQDIDFGIDWITDGEWNVGRHRDHPGLVFFQKGDAAPAAKRVMPDGKLEDAASPFRREIPMLPTARQPDVATPPSRTETAAPTPLRAAEAPAAAAEGPATDAAAAAHRSGETVVAEVSARDKAVDEMLNEFVDIQPMVVRKTQAVGTSTAPSPINHRSRADLSSGAPQVELPDVEPIPRLGGATTRPDVRTRTGQTLTAKSRKQATPSTGQMPSAIVAPSPFARVEVHAGGGQSSASPPVLMAAPSRGGGRRDGRTEKKTPELPGFPDLYRRLDDLLRDFRDHPQRKRVAQRIRECRRQIGRAEHLDQVEEARALLENLEADLHDETPTGPLAPGKAPDELAPAASVSEEASTLAGAPSAIESVRVEEASASPRALSAIESVTVERITLGERDRSWVRETFKRRESASMETRASAVDTLRGRYMPEARAHAIYREDLNAQIKAIQAINDRIEEVARQRPIDRAVAFEYGGTFLMDQMPLLAGLGEAKVKRISKGDIEGQHHEHQRNELKAAVGDLMTTSPGGGHVVVVETYVSGSSAIGMTKQAVKPLLNRYPGLHITLVLLQETTGRSRSKLIEGQRHGIPHKVEARVREKARIPKATRAGSRLSFVSQNVPIIIGEDIDPIRGPLDPSKEQAAVVVYTREGDDFVGYKITPTGGKTTRELVLELLQGRPFERGRPD